MTMRPSPEPRSTTKSSARTPASFSISSTISLGVGTYGPALCCTCCARRALGACIVTPNIASAQRRLRTTPSPLITSITHSVKHALQCSDHRLISYVRAVASEVSRNRVDAPASLRPTEADHADRFLGRAAGRPGDAGDRDRDLG